MSKQNAAGFTGSGTWKMIINVLLLILGIIFIAAPTQALTGVAITLGIVLIIYGGLVIAMNEVRKARGQSYNSIVWPIIWLVLGILLLIFAGSVAGWLMPLIIGAWMIVLGIMNLRSSHRIHQAGGGHRATFATVLAIAEIILGILSICSIANGGAGLGIMIGICMLIYGICAIVSWAMNYISLRET